MVPGSGERQVIIELHSKNCACKGSGFETLPSGVRASCSPRYVLRIPLDRWIDLGRPSCIEDAVDKMSKKGEEK